MGFSLQSGKKGSMTRRDISYQDKLNELRLDISHPNSQGINFIFVEGESDIRLFRKLFDEEKCKIENIPRGNPKLDTFAKYFKEVEENRKVSGEILESLLRVAYDLKSFKETTLCSNLKEWETRNNSIVF